MEDSEIGLEQYLFGFEASQFIWNLLWKRDQPAFTEMNTLDVVQLSSSGITGWIFTAADGAVRSKLQSRWNASSVGERASGDAKKEVLSDFYDASAQKYIVLNNKQVLKDLVDAPHANPSALILYGHLAGTSLSYMEVNYDFPITIVKSAPPKLTCYNLVDSKARGRIASESETTSSLVPNDKILCLNKNINGTLKSFVQSLVKKVEKKYKNHVSKMSLIVLLEAIPASEFAHLHPNQRDSVPEKRVWLHHCTELVTVRDKSSKNRRGSLLADNSASEMGGSVQSNGDFSAMSGTTLSSRTAKLGLSCIGDFCFYDSIESRKSGFDFLDDDDEFNLKEEAAKAINRHRKVDQEADPDSDPDEMHDEFDKTFEEKPISSTNAAVNANQNSLKAALKGSTAAAVVPVKKMKVTLKSIILARDEMSAIERLEQVMINQEMAKLARGGSNKNLNSVNAETGDGATSSSGSHWPKALQTWWLQVGRSLTKSKGGVVSIPLSSGHKIDQARLSSLTLSNESVSNTGGVSDLNDTNIDQYIDAIVKSDSVNGTSESVPNIRDHKNNLGHLSWYYSNVRVCEHCYLVYRELDRKRKLKYKKLLQSQREELEKREDNKGKEIERKIFEQRQFVSRLAKIDPKRIADEQNLQPNSVSNYGSVGRQSSYGIAGGNSLAFDSVITDNNSYFDQAAAMLYERELQAKKAAKQLVGAPKGALPPLPWQLSNSSQRELYEKTGNTFAVRNIMEMKLDRHASSVHVDDNIEDVWAEATGIAALDNAAGGGGGSSITAGMKLMQEKRRSQKKGQLLGKIQSSKSNKNVGGGGNGWKYNADRLMHPWQRDLQKLRQLQAKNNAGLTGTVLDQMDREEQEEEEGDEYDDYEAEEEEVQFRSQVQRHYHPTVAAGAHELGSHTLKASQSHKAVIGQKSPTRRVNSLSSLHHPRKGLAKDDQHLLSEGSMVSQLTMGSSLLNVNGGGSLMQSSVDDDDFLSGKMFHSPKEGKKKSGASGHAKPPLKPLIQLTSVTHQQPHSHSPSAGAAGSSSGGGGKHFNHLKNMASKDAGSHHHHVTLNPVSPALIAATIVDRNTPDSLHSAGSVGFANGSNHSSGGSRRGSETGNSPARSNLASAEGSRPTTSQMGSRGGGSNTVGGLLNGTTPPIVSPTVGLLKKVSGGAASGVAAGGGTSSPFGSQMSRSSSSKMLKRSDSIAEMEIESDGDDDDDDDDDGSVASEYHTVKVSSPVKAKATAATTSNSKSNTGAASPVKSIKSQVVAATVHRSTASTASAAADDSGEESGEDDDEDDVGGPIGYSPFVISFKV